MKCHVDGCMSEAMYKKDALCQKHYFRIMRNGSTELVREKKLRETGRTKKYRIQNPAGYQKLNEPNHPLVDGYGYVYEHRFIVYARYGEELPPCEICGKPTFWNTCHIDHKDEDVTNNHPDNLRPVCRGCNTSRTKRSTSKRIEYDGKNLTYAEWELQPGVTAGRNQIRARYNKGFSIHDCLFMENVTHPKN